jgi:hypothetical protein
MHRITLCLIALGLLAAAGCTTSTGKGVVEGTVTLDGQPLKSGLICFMPANGKSATADTTITDGRFSLEVPIGEKYVDIRAPKVIGQQKMYDTPNSPTGAITTELLPARYNVQSELTMTVKPGKQTKDFELTLGPAKGR